MRYDSERPSLCAAEPWVTAEATCACSWFNVLFMLNLSAVFLRETGPYGFGGLASWTYLNTVNMNMEYSAYNTNLQTYNSWYLIINAYYYYERKCVIHIGTKVIWEDQSSSVGDGCSICVRVWEFVEGPRGRPVACRSPPVGGSGGSSRSGTFLLGVRLRLQF